MIAFLWNLVPIAIVTLLTVMIVRAGGEPLWKEAYRRLSKNPQAIFAIAVLFIYGAVAFCDSISWQDNKRSNSLSILDRICGGVKVERTYSAPMANMTTGEPTPHKLMSKHILGTDGTGKDVLVQTMKGARTAIIIGCFTTILATPLALFFGMIAGYFGKRVDDAVQYIYTTMASIPDILLLIALLLVLGRGLNNLCYALGITAWIGLCRLTRGEALKHRDREYVRAAKALGVSPARIMIRHILPNLLPVVIISITLNLSSLVLSETILTYLGFGVGNDVGSWGNMIDQARLELAREPVILWNLASASVALFVLVLAFNLLGDALRDALDPRLRSS